MFVTLSFAIGIGIFISLIAFSLLSHFENEKRARDVAFMSAIFISAIFLIIPLISFTLTQILVILFILSSVVILFPYNGQQLPDEGKPPFPFDERDTMFSRNELQPESENFIGYYNRNKDQKNLDDTFRKKAGLLSEKAPFYDMFSFLSAESSFETVKLFHPHVDKMTPSEKKVINPKELTEYIKKWSKLNGAISVGVTEVKPYHYYTYRGRGEAYGEKVEPQHKYAIAITVEMDKNMMDVSPYGPVITESAHQYFASGAIAFQIASFLNKLGYSSRAHIDGNYHVVCPLVARDAGLGEIGRMGLLMTPELGPRVRISVVTTDAPLVLNEKTYDPTITHFCSICKKCADICPSKAIPFDNRKMIDETLRWKINSEKCFIFWSTVGTDCGRCMSVCPYSHPNNLMHNFVRYFLKKSKLFRYFALKMDDFFYGRKPESKKYNIIP